MSDHVPISRKPSAQSSHDAKLHMSETLKSGLYIVATPIGNLRDITLRALDILKAADIILAEDTRHTQKLLKAYDIEGRLVSYHDHNVAKRLPEVLKWLEAGKTIAQVSDAGTPLISDPGFKLVRAVREAGYDVVPVPGASSVLAALMGAGLPTDKFTFIGFLPAKTTARQKALTAVIDRPETIVFFESGPRLSASLSDMAKVLGERQVVIARELTKKYEEFLSGTLSKLSAEIAAKPVKGEIVVLVSPPDAKSKWDMDAIDESLRKHLPEMGTKRASNHVAELSGWSKRDVYARAQLLK